MYYDLCNHVDGRRRTTAVGEQAPDFELPDVGPHQSAEESSLYELGDFVEAGSVDLSFHMFDFNPTCTGQVCGLRDAEWFALASDVSVLGISTDSVYSHADFSQQHDLDFPLLADSDGRVSESYDVLYDEIDHHRRVSQRAVFVIDQTQTIVYSWVPEDNLTLPDWMAVKDAIEEIQG